MKLKVFIFCCCNNLAYELGSLIGNSTTTKNKMKIRSVRQSNERGRMTFNSNPARMYNDIVCFLFLFFQIFLCAMDRDFLVPEVALVVGFWQI